MNINVFIDYKDRDILLSKEDFIQNIKLEISPHKIQGSYISYENYLNSLFYLEYEDCYRALKKEMFKLQSDNKSINLMDEEEIKNINKNSHLFFYLDGIIRFINFGRNGVIIKMDFRPSYQRLNSKMMKYGSLVILTNNIFEEYIFTTVFSNEIKLINEENHIYRVYLSLLDINHENILFLLKNRKNLQVFESKAYFESYIHVMRRLQEMNEHNLPFEQELIFGKFQTQINSSRKINIPSLDPSQINAINRSLSNKISLIQGPPGTGKTYVGIILVRALLQLEPNSQILVVSYTNHALDSFLEEIIKYTQSVVRIGGRCNNEKIQNYILDSSDKYYNNNYKRYLKDLDREGENIENFINNEINCDNLLNVQQVKDKFKVLYDKIYTDFFDLANIRENFYINYNKIYILWNLLDIIDDEEFQDKLFSLLTEDHNTNYYEQQSIFNQLYNNCGQYYRDNVHLLNQLYQNNYRMYTQNINLDNFNYNEDNNDDDEEDDNDDAFFYMENNSYSSEDDCEENDNDIDIIYNRLPPLNEDQFNYLLDCNVNAFKFGPKIIRLIKDFMKFWLFENDDDFNNFDFEGFNATLNRNNEYSLLHNYHIVGMTTTGCAKFSKILEKSNFETIIVEEAAEVLESRIVSLLTKNTKRLILIGDHKQLKPKPYNYELETKYNFNISMFERLINNNIQYSPLIYQRRMKSIFADFVRIIYGDNLYKDHPDINNKEKVKGMKYDMFIITHNKSENEIEEIKSKFNIYEAKYLVNLCVYLLKQGYKNNQITILTFYKEQARRIKLFLRNMNISNIRVSSIDNYQGEECDIILLSLVRSNKKNKIGFLNNFNRVCVAFSRAKIGLYIIGNIECIIKGEKENKNIIDPKMKDVWQKIYAKATSLNIIGEKLTLCCQTHGNEMVISNLEDFNNLSQEGGCKEKCNKKMKCGHLCQLLCHIKTDCNEIKCKQPCKRIKLNCSLNKHFCKKLCYEKCDICEELVDKQLSCGHIKKGCKCYIKINSIRCEEIVNKKLSCGHIKKGCKCFIDANTIKCEEIVYKKLSCGHIKRCKCYIDANTIKCEEKCERRLKCGHFCQLKCYENCNSQKCKQKIEFSICAHIKEIECFTLNYPDIFKNNCKQNCDIKKICNHPCNGTCDECLEGKLHIKCEEKCEKLLFCGHICNKKCFEECICESYSHKICSHMSGSFNYGDKIICDKKCNIGCKHKKCNKKCEEFCERKPCEKRCDIRMKCGHQCFGLCGERCPDLCKICNSNEKCFNNIKENELLYKTKCGHIFSVNELDKYFYNNKRNIEIYRCPKCNNFLLNEPRYQNQIKIFFMDIQKIKKIIIQRYINDNKINILKSIIDIKDRILKQYESGAIRIFDLLPENINNNKNCFSYKTYNQKRRMPIIYNFIYYWINWNKNYSEFKLFNLAEKFMGIEYYIDDILKRNDIKNALKNEFKFIKNYLNIKKYFENINRENIVINDDFYQSLKKIIDNMVYYLIFKLRNNNNLLENQNLLERTQDIYNSNFSLDLDLKDIYKENYKGINIEIMDLNKSFESKWYKCKYGHYYSTNKYELPPKEYKCLECAKEGEKILFITMIIIIALLFLNFILK